MKDNDYILKSRKNAYLIFSLESSKNNTSITFGINKNNYPHLKI